MDTGVALVLSGGAATFGNEWMQNGELNWRVPIAVMLLAGLDGALSALSPSAGLAFGAIVFTGAIATPLNGKSVIDEFNSQFTGSAVKKKGK